MQHNKPIHTLTIKELRDQEAEILHFLADPKNTPDDHRVMNNVLKQIREQIAIKSAPAPLPPQASAKDGQQIKHNTPPTPPQRTQLSESFKLSENSPQPPTPNQPITKIIPGKPDQLTTEQIAQFSNIQINAQLNTSPPTVTINWPDWGPRTYIEREAKSQFLTAVRDLAESKLYTQGRYEIIPLKYVPWWRGIQYYKALTAFWNRPPTARDLEISHKKTAQIHIFQLITQAALQPQT